MYNYGNCYKFNSGRNFTGHTIQMHNTSIQGSEHGLSMGISLPNKNKYPTSLSSGLIVYVHEASYMALDSQEIHVQRGKMVNLAVHFISILKN